jgi:hybrid cluster-associated redox disulfide protein
MSIADDDLVDEVMRGKPRTIRVFLAFQMGCVGCPLACFHTVADACREHHIDGDVFLAALHECAEHDPEQWEPVFRKDHAREES